MSGNKLLDTNILIFLSKRTLLLESISTSKDKLFISVITYMEALGYDFKNEEEKLIISKLCKEIEIINLDQEIVDKVITIRRKKKIKLPDAIIGATALIHKLELITVNVQDFIGVGSELTIKNPLK